MKKYNATIEAQISALQAWAGKTRDVAEEIVENLLKEHNGETDAFYQALDNQAYGSSSIMVAQKEIEARKNDLLNPETRYDTIINILRSIHDKWVAENGFKVWRGNWAETEQKLFQHLPVELIGMQETAKDLMFLAPFLNEMGIDCGKMGEGAWAEFTPSQDVVNAYQKAVDKFCNIHHINSNNIGSRLKYIIAGYSPLKEEKSPAKKLPLEVVFNKNNKTTLHTQKEVVNFRNEMLYSNVKLLANDINKKVELDNGLARQ